MGLLPARTYLDVVDVDFVGVVNTFLVALPHLQDGASMIATGSVAAPIPGSVDDAATGPGGAGYAFAKRAIAQLVREFSVITAPRKIRVNAVHPTNCDTMLMHNDPIYKVYRPDLENPTEEDASVAFPAMQAMPVPMIDPIDVSHAVVYLASDESRLVTGLQLRVDAGAVPKQVVLPVLSL